MNLKSRTSNSLYQGLTVSHIMKAKLDINSNIMQNNDE